MEDLTGLGHVATAVASVANNIIDKVSNAVGIMYTDSNYKMKKDAMGKLYEKIVEYEEIDEFSKAAIISNLQQELKHYNNQRAVLERTINMVDESIDISTVDDDWIAFFFDKVKNISSEEMQFFWSKVLSEEFNKPNSIPKSLIHTLSCIDLKVAKTFNNLCQFAVKNITDDEEVIFFKQICCPKEVDISFSSLKELERYGLIALNDYADFVYKELNGYMVFEVNGNNLTVYGNDKNEVPFGDIFLTLDGRALCKCIEKKNNVQLEDMFLTILTSCTVEKNNQGTKVVPFIMAG